MRASKTFFMVMVAIGISLTVFFGIAASCKFVVPPLLDIAIKYRFILMLSPIFIISGVIVLITLPRAQPIQLPTDIKQPEDPTGNQT